jgi:hypothetical protein
MTIDKKDLFEQKVKEIDNKLQNLSLTDNERQHLVEQRSELEDFELENEEFELENEVYNEDLDNEDSDNEEYQSIYFKYCFEQCNNITEVINTLNSLKEYFEQLSKDGNELVSPVCDGYCFFNKVNNTNS